MRIPDTPLFVKTHDFLLWLLLRTQRFPKHLRHSYTLKLETMALDFQEAILMANTVRGSERLTWLDRADGKLICLRG
ncbi:MAG: four helix bundle protein [Planctomycetes bacterium]|nr:four helix bundle protein [Planctomycetota bacterium]